MAEVVVTSTALAGLEELIRTHSLPTETKERFRLAVRDLGRFPELGPSLEGKWRGYRFILGPWRWMIVVYHYEPAQGIVAVVTVQDGRSRRSATFSR
jgi:plasmid stabilization system protein ParE